MKKYLVIICISCLFLLACGNSSNEEKEELAVSPEVVEEVQEAGKNIGEEIEPKEEIEEAGKQVSEEEAVNKEPEATPEVMEADKENESATEELQIIITDVNETMYARQTVNVRSGCGTKYEKVGALEKGQEVIRTGISDNNWSRINYQGQEAYVSSSFLQTEPIAGGQMAAAENPQEEAPSGNTPNEKQQAYMQQAEIFYSSNYNDFLNEIAKINDLRVSLGKSQLTVDDTLCKLACYRAYENANEHIIGHYYADGSKCLEESSPLYNITYLAGENVHQAYSTGGNVPNLSVSEYINGSWGSEGPSKPFDSLVDSQAHYNNMTNDKWTKVGVGAAKANGWWVLVQLFSR